MLIVLHIPLIIRMCPFISKMFFIFHEECAPSYLVLDQFEYLTDLELFGGSFYRDRIPELLERRGSGLTRLHLISVASVDYRVVN